MVRSLADRTFQPRPEEPAAERAALDDLPGCAAERIVADWIGRDVAVVDAASDADCCRACWRDERCQFWVRPEPRVCVLRADFAGFDFAPAAARGRVAAGLPRGAWRDQGVRPTLVSPNR